MINLKSRIPGEAQSGGFQPGTVPLWNSHSPCCRLVVGIFQCWCESIREFANKGMQTAVKGGCHACQHHSHSSEGLHFH